MVAGSFYELDYPDLRKADRNFLSSLHCDIPLHSFGKQFLQFLDAVPAGEIGKAFAAIAFREIDLQHVLKQSGQLIKCHTSKNLVGDSLFFSKTATEDHVVTFDCVATLIHLCPKQADVAHVVLGARIRATGQMDVNRLIEL